MNFGNLKSNKHSASYFKNYTNTFIYLNIQYMKCYTLHITHILYYVISIIYYRFVYSINIILYKHTFVIYYINISKYIYKHI